MPTTGSPLDATAPAAFILPEPRSKSALDLLYLGHYFARRMNFGALQAVDLVVVVIDAAGACRA